MPNWTTNVLTIRGPERELALLAGELDGCVLDAGGVAAVTEMLAGDDERVGELVAEMLAGGQILTFCAHVPDPLNHVGPDGDWYRARLRAWGTKWDACEAELITVDDGVRQYRFDTAWCPPIEWFQALCGLRPGMEMELAASEESEGWLGTWCSRAGSAEVDWDGSPLDDEQLVDLFGWCPDDDDE